MEKSGGTSRQPSSHLGPKGYDVVPPKDKKVGHQEVSVLMAECRLSKPLFAAGATWLLFSLVSVGLLQDLSLP